MELVLLVGSLVAILGAAELFTNGIEWFGHKLDLAEGAVGSVLAAVATAMPETLIPTIAILGPAISGGDPEASHAIGVGAILGAPFMLSTLAMFVTGVAVLAFARRGRRETRLAVNVPILGRDVAVFLVGYAIAIGTAFLPQDVAWIKWAAAGFLLLLYAGYVWLHFRDDAPESDASDLNRLHATRLPGMAEQHSVEFRLMPGDRMGERVSPEPRMRIVVAQVVAAIALIVIGAQAFVT
jgi:cation:H+ antiporter